MRVMEEQLGKVLKEELEKIKPNAPDVDDPDALDEYFDEMSHIEHLIEEDFKPTARYSMIVFLHTVLEDHLHQYCAYVKSEMKLPIDVTELREVGPIKRAKKYLKKLAGLDVDKFPEWAELDEFQKVRNCIVHNYGYLDRLTEPQFKEIKLIAKKYPDLVTDTYGERLTPPADYCEKHLQLVTSLFEKRLFPLVKAS